MEGLLCGQEGIRLRDPKVGRKPEIVNHAGYTGTMNLPWGSDFLSEAEARASADAEKEVRRQ